MPYRPFSEQNCSIANALAVVGERWSLLVMREILFGRSRFSEIKRNLGVAPNILSDRLQQLVEHGLLERRPAGGGGESHEYVATPKGRAVSPVLSARLHCSYCGEPIGPGELQSRPGPGATPKQIADGILPRTAGTPTA